MNKIRVEGATLKVGAGTLLGLTRDQAMARFHRVQKTETEGVYKTREPQEFKAGEVLSIAIDDVPKHLRGNVVDLDAPIGEAAPVAAAAPRRGRPPKA